MRLTNTIRDSFVRAAMSDVPKVDYQQETIKVVQAALPKLLPAKIVEIYQDPKLREYLDYRWKIIGCTSINLPVLSDFKLDAKTQETVQQLQEKHKQQTETHRELENKLKSVAISCTTRKALAAALPEFEKYLPADEEAACKTLPALANVLSDFVKAGWPKDQKKIKETK